MSHRVRRAHAVLTPEAELMVDFGVASCEHASVARGKELSGMK